MDGAAPVLTFNTLSRAAGKDQRTQAWLAQQDEPDPTRRRNFSIQHYTPAALQARLATFAQSFGMDAVLNRHCGNWAKMAGFPADNTLQQVFVLQAVALCGLPLVVSVWALLKASRRP